MSNVVLGSIACAVVVVAVLVAIYFVVRSRRRKLAVTVTGILDQYFRHHVTADELGKRVKAIADRFFLQGGDFYALSVAAFQRAVDRARAAGSAKEEERALLGLLAALKNEFGLPDLYQARGWRAGRE